MSAKKKNANPAGGTPAAFAVGIDLGTTASVLAAVRLDSEIASGRALGLEILPIPQLVAVGTTDDRPGLPSYLYLPGTGDAETAPFAGELARSRGAEVPHRLVASAKSWLVHEEADLTAPILPAGAPDDVAKVSPVDAAAAYLTHLAGAWNDAHPDAPLAAQDVFVAVPASFDAVARELTLQAARKAGLPGVTLVEEPQAACYAWLAARGDTWRKELGVGDTLLVADLGGGTTDFTLISVAEVNGTLELERIAVGDHILLGGDNMDLALAGLVAKQSTTKLDSWQQRGLVHACRAAKERLLAADAPAQVPITLLGRGSKLLGGTIKLELTREDAEKVLVDGFFPRAAVEDRPAQRRRAGLVELGLPYAADAGITRHLAAFLGAHGRMPTAVLYNGGVMKGAALRTRLGEVIASWTGAAPRELGGTDLDQAVAVGAAYYGLVRTGRGVRIRGGAARTYYIGVEKAVPAVPGMDPPLEAICVVPFGMEEGTEATVPGRDLGLVVGEEVEFRFLTSSVRKDALGDVIEDWDEGELEERQPMVATLPIEAAGGKKQGSGVPVKLETKLTEVGTLELWCVAKDGGRWRLEFDVRGEHS